MFAEVLGHDRLRAVLGGALSRSRLPHSMLFSGPEGVGKRQLALSVATALVCEAPAAPGACGRCRSCRRVRTARDGVVEQRAALDGLSTRPDPSRYNFALHPDLVFAVPSRGSVKIEQVRDLVREIGALPFEAASRALVIDDAHTMTEQAQNALLKSLEEPPQTSYVILVTASPQGMLPTIRSRCQELRFGALSVPLIEQHLRDESGMDGAEAHLRAVLSGGSLGSATAIETGTWMDLRAQMVDLLTRAPRSTAIDRLQIADQMKALPDTVGSLTALRSLLRDVAMLAAGGDASRLVNSDIGEQLSTIAATPLGARAALLAEAVADTRDALLGRIPGQPNLKQGPALELLALDVLLDAFAAA